VDQTFMNSTDERLRRLEGAVFAGKRASTKVRHTDVGPTGGLRTLTAQGFFKSKRNLADGRAALEENDYHYSAQAVDMALKRLSKRDGPLVSFKQGGKKLYAKRK
jgi:hypothetical protein